MDSLRIAFALCPLRPQVRPQAPNEVARKQSRSKRNGVIRAGLPQERYCNKKFDSKNSIQLSRSSSDRHRLRRTGLGNAMTGCSVAIPKRSGEVHDRAAIRHSRASRGAPYENARDCVAWHCGPFYQLVVSVCPRWLRPEPPPQCVGLLRLGWSKSSLVLKAYRPSGRSHAQWEPALLPLIAISVRNINDRAGDSRRLFHFGEGRANSPVRGRPICRGVGMNRAAP